MTQLSLASQYYARLEAREHIANSVELTIAQLERTSENINKTIEVVRMQGNTQISFIDEDLTHLVATIGFVPPPQETIQMFPSNYARQDIPQEQEAA